MRWTAALGAFCATIMATSTQGAVAAAGPAPADLILHNAVVVPVDPPGARATAVAVRGNRIALVGADAEALALAGPRTRVVDLKGRAVIPGLTDAHGHVSSLGFALLRVDAVGTRSAAEVAALVRHAATKVPAGGWILGRGWDQNDWEAQGFPDRRALDEAAPDHRVALERIDGHALWVSTAALSAAGITRKTPDPPGGRILRDADGHPTGILVDRAADLVEARIPAPDRESVKQAILRALDRCLDSGLTSVHDAGIPPEEVGIYKELAASGSLPIRVYAMIGGTARTLDDYFAEPHLVGLGGGFFTLRAIKLGVDGALGSRGAALLEDYADEPGWRGLVTRGGDEIQALASQAAAKGYQVCVHAIGDRGNRIALDALERALRAAPPGDHRFRIEHAQVLHPEDIPRFKLLGILPSMQPVHCTSDMPWAPDRLGPKRIRGAYAWRRLLAAGALIASGSDFPVESENPFHGLYAAVTRQDGAGNPPGGWEPSERMTAEEALRSFTLGAAYAAFEEAERGSIAASKKADLVVLPASPLAIGPAELRSMRPLAVIVDGRVARAAPEIASELPPDLRPPAARGSAP
jgi:predicted amidohydrolase YtcJ